MNHIRNLVIASLLVLLSLTTTLVLDQVTDGGYVDAALAGGGVAAHCSC